MIIKALFLGISCASCVVVLLPPVSSIVEKLNKDKIKDFFVTRVGLMDLFFILASAAVALETAVYIFFMIFAKSIDASVLSQLQDLKAWHALATFVALYGSVVRIWSSVTLGSLFKYESTLRSGHKLTQAGLYTQLRHPSYTGTILNLTAAHILLWRQGLWVVASFCILRVASLASFYLRLAEIPLIDTALDLLLDPFIATGSPLGIDPRIGVVVSFAMLIGVILYRIKNEEAKLKERFGAEWDAYASKRRRLIPYVY
ncbi:hypothetical protein BGZ68_002869 [Mortierella alpina]|nr:hypothetical protein BGZ68_002869 [Mortierella alpina]